MIWKPQKNQHKTPDCNTPTLSNATAITHQPVWGRCGWRVHVQESLTTRCPCPPECSLEPSHMFGTACASYAQWFLHTNKEGYGEDRAINLPLSSSSSSGQTNLQTHPMWSSNAWVASSKRTVLSEVPSLALTEKLLHVLFPSCLRKLKQTLPFHLRLLQLLLRLSHRGAQLLNHLRFCAVVFSSFLGGDLFV